jgi:hypothetical protein
MHGSQRLPSTPAHPPFQLKAGMQLPSARACTRAQM